MQLPQAGFGSPIWVLARALCRFKAVDLANVPEAKRAQALLLQITQFSPYATTDHYAVWQGGRALVWYWDQGALLHSMSALGLASQHVRVWPESVLYAPLASGLRLIKNLHGVEGQFWQDGKLLQCRWWQQRPDAREWLDFQRDIGLMLDARQIEIPTEQALALQAEPTLRAISGATGGWSNMRLAYALGMLLLFLPTAWIGSGLLKTEIALHEVRAAINAVEIKAQPLQEARNQALRTATRTQALVALDPYPDQLDLMARIASILPKGGAYLREWDFQDGKLKVVLVTQGNSPSSSALVSALQQAGGFDNVQIVPGADPKVIVITMNALRAPARV